MFEVSVAWLRRHRVLLPGVRVLERLVASVREQADERLYAVVARQAVRARRACRAGWRSCRWCRPVGGCRGC
ncbi:protein of unknown function [Thermomonospora echinospora]|uniref:DUF4158 domain-containing protein n=1 Tax=Thermomonospora echinospora TaxID=1992 RepID=A0A1H6DAG9_9ACTN|nr:protein of unknown function [Thermomonospora echinospora]